MAAVKHSTPRKSLREMTREARGRTSAKEYMPPETEDMDADWEDRSAAIYTLFHRDGRTDSRLFA